MSHLSLTPSDLARLNVAANAADDAHREYLERAVMRCGLGVERDGISLHHSFVPTPSGGRSLTSKEHPARWKSRGWYASRPNPAMRVVGQPSTTHRGLVGCHLAGPMQGRAARLSCGTAAYRHPDLFLSSASASPAVPPGADESAAPVSVPATSLADVPRLPSAEPAPIAVTSPELR